MGMFGMFGKKKDSSAADTGDYGSDMVGMMKMMAGMPHMMRKPMMKGRINQLLSLPEEKRQESLRDMIGAFHSPEVNDSTREKLVATRVEIIGEMTEDRRRTIMTSRVAALKVAPELDEKDQQVTQRILPEISDSARAAFTATWGEVVKGAGS